MSGKRTGRSLLVWMLLLVTLLCGCSHQSAPGADRSDGAGSVVGSSAAEKKEPEAEYIVYPGFVDQNFTVDNHILIMPNSAKNEQNQVRFVFMVTGPGEEELFTSEPVAPGEQAEWDVTNRWHGRSHTIRITAIPILPDGREGNSSTQTIQINIDYT